MSLLALLCPSSGNAQSTTSASTGNFPRVGNIWWGATLYTASPSEASHVQLYLGPQFSSAQASAVRAADPNAAMLVDVNLMETTGGLPSVPSSYFLLDTNGNKICNWPGNPPNYILNMTNPTVAQFVGQYAAQVLAQSGSAYNGVFFDNLIASIASKTTDCYGNAIQISSQGNGVADNPATLNAAWAAGLYTALAAFKSKAPGAYAVAHANQIPPDVRSLGVLNGDAFVFDVPNIREGKLAFGNLWDAYHEWFQKGRTPVLSAIQSSPPSQIAYGYGYTPGKSALPQTVAFGKSFYPNMRFGLALSMMDDGYFIHDFGDNSSPVSWWYDEYNFNMGMPAAPYQLLGAQSGPNLLANGGFESALSPWLFTVANNSTGAASLQIDTGASQEGVASAHVDVTSAGSAAYGIMLEQDTLPLTKGVEYTIDFWAKGDVYFPVKVNVQGGKPNFANYGLSNTVTVGPGWRHYSVSFISSATATDGRLEFQFGCYTGNVWLDNIKLSAAPARIYRRDFQNGVVLLNGTNSPQTIPLEAGLKRFSGSQAPRYQYIVDDGDAGFSASGTWTVKTFDSGWRKASGPYYHAWNTTLHELDGSAGSARWNLGIPADGQYTIQVWLPAAPSTGTWTTNAQYQLIQGASVLATVSLNQTNAGQGDQWFNLGTFNLTAAQHPALQVQNGGSGSLIADAVYVFSAVDKYNNGAAVTQVTVPPMDGILLQRQSPTQSITFPAPAGQVLGSQLTLKATASSGLVVSYSSNSPLVCQAAGDTASFESAGTCSITARQPGGSGYTAAVPVTQTFSVSAVKGALSMQSITFAPIPTQSMGGVPLTVTASASSGLPVTITSGTASVCTVSAGTVTLIAPGTCSLVASQSGNTSYAVAASVTQSFQVVKNLAVNGAFDAGTLTPWKFILTADGSARATASLDSTNAVSTPASVLVNVSTAATANWHIDLEQGSIPITAGKTYEVQFWASSSTARSIQVVAQGGSPSFANYGLSSVVKLGTGWAKYTLTFTANTTASDCRLEFYFGSAASGVHLDNVQFFALN